MDIKEILNSLLAATGADKPGLLAGAGPVASRNSGSKTGSFEDVLARLTSTKGQASSGSGASGAPASESAVNAPAGSRGVVQGNGASEGSSSGNAGTLVVSGNILPSSNAVPLSGTARSGESTQAGKALVSLAEDLSKLLALLSGLQNMSPSQAQAAVVAASGGQVTPSEARAFLNDLNAFVQKAKGAANPLQLPSAQQDALLVQLLQQMAQGQQVLWGPVAGSDASGKSGSGSSKNQAGQLQLLFAELGWGGAGQSGSAGFQVFLRFQNFQMVAFFGNPAAGDAKASSASADSGAASSGSSVFQTLSSDALSALNQALGGSGSSGGTGTSLTSVLTNPPAAQGALDQDFRMLVQLLFQSGVSRAVLTTMAGQGSSPASTNAFAVQNQILPGFLSGGQGAAPPTASTPSTPLGIPPGKEAPLPGVSVSMVEASKGTQAALSVVPPQAPPAPFGPNAATPPASMDGKGRAGNEAAAPNASAAQTVSMTPAPTTAAGQQMVVTGESGHQPSAATVVSTQAEPAGAKSLPPNPSPVQGIRAGASAESVQPASPETSVFSGEASQAAQVLPADGATTGAIPVTVETASFEVAVKGAVVPGSTPGTGPAAVSAGNVASGQGSTDRVLPTGLKGDPNVPAPEVQNSNINASAPRGQETIKSTGADVSSSQTLALPGTKEGVSGGTPASGVAVLDTTTNGSNPLQSGRQTAGAGSTAAPNPGSQPAATVVPPQDQSGLSAAAAVSSGEVGKATLAGAGVNNSAVTSLPVDQANPTVSSVKPLSADAVTATAPGSGSGLSNGPDLNKTNMDTASQGGLALNAGSLVNGADNAAGISSAASLPANSLPANGAVDSGQILTQITQQVEAQAATAHTVSRLSFQLVPQNLGRVTVQIVLADQSVSARIVVTNPDVREVIQHHMVELRTSLNQAGLQIDQLQVQVGGGSSNLLGQYYQYQQEGSGGYRNSSTPAYLPPEEPKNAEKSGLLAPSSARMSLVDVLI